MDYTTFRESAPHRSFGFPLDYYHFGIDMENGYVPYHWHPEWEIIHIIKGSLPLMVNRERYELKEGTFFLLTAGNLHSVQWSHCEYESLVWDYDRIVKPITTATDKTTKAAKNMPFSNHYRIIPDLSNHPKLSEICQQLFACFPHFSEINQYYSMAYLYQLLGAIKEEAYYESLPEESLHFHKLEMHIKSALTYIEEHYMEDITLQKLAHTAGLNNKYFCKIFKTVTDHTPMEYVNRYRIDVAKQKLTSNLDDSISEIADACGYGDVSYFIRVFKKLTGVTPLKYRHL